MPFAADHLADRINRRSAFIGFFRSIASLIVNALQAVGPPRAINSLASRQQVLL